MAVTVQYPTRARRRKGIRRRALYREIEWITRLRKALEFGGFELYARPITTICMTEAN